MRRLVPGGARLRWRLLAALWLLAVLLLLLLYGLLTRRVCTKRPFVHRDLLEASVHEVGQVLERHGVQFCLCYGSLWGQIHERRNPAWEADAELCLLRASGVGADGDDDSLLSDLRRAGFTAELNARRGLYDVYPSDGTPGLVQLILFSADAEGQVYRRDGWQHRALGADCVGSPQLHCFPAALVAPPLQRRPFGRHALPVPWRGFELQKHLYRDSWFRDYAPTC